MIGFKNAFNIKNKYVDAYLACDKETNSMQWIEIIQSIKSTPARNTQEITEKDLEEM